MRKLLYIYMYIYMYITFNNKIYIQKDGVAMGLPLGPVFLWVNLKPLNITKCASRKNQIKNYSYEKKSP